MNPIDLRSDTVTKPSQEMLQAMMSASVGDDVYGEDPTTQELQEFGAKMFGHDAALWLPSGTMSNQVAIKCHTEPMDEVICDVNAHIFQYENGGYAFNSGVAVKLIQGSQGRITAEQIETEIHPDYHWLPKTKLVSIENTCNKAGGGFYDWQEVKKISKLCKEKKLKFHLDGARIFNALVEDGNRPQDIGPLFDSISVCLSKGLGAPAGTLLIGNSKLIYKAKRWRKAWGGGMRQTGYITAAGLYALQNNVEGLAQDHDRARKLGEIVKHWSFVTNVEPVYTNILLFDVDERLGAMEVINQMKTKGVIGSPFGKNRVRFCTHLDINDEMLEEVSKLKF